ncbi:MAG: hypothetical protein IJB86_07005 [Clostridia bacterium]|nr:hypothetical protein [Clostridia bacterium]
MKLLKKSLIVLLSICMAFSVLSLCASAEENQQVGLFLNAAEIIAAKDGDEKTATQMKLTFTAFDENGEEMSEFPYVGINTQTNDTLPEDMTITVYEKKAYNLIGYSESELEEEIREIDRLLFTLETQGGINIFNNLNRERKKLVEKYTAVRKTVVAELKPVSLEGNILTVDVYSRDNEKGVKFINAYFEGMEDTPINEWTFRVPEHFFISNESTAINKECFFDNAIIGADEKFFVNSSMMSKDILEEYACYYGFDYVRWAENDIKGFLKALPTLLFLMPIYTIVLNSRMQAYYDLYDIDFIRIMRNYYVDSIFMW